MSAATNSSKRWRRLLNETFVRALMARQRLRGWWTSAKGLVNFMPGVGKILFHIAEKSQLPPALTSWPAGRPLVSIVIPCHNYGKYLMEAVDSVLAQTWQELEVVVVDDGSDDPETVRIIEGLRLPRVRTIRQRNLKLPSARNAGISSAQGKYICCLDADDKLEPTYIEKCVHRLAVEGFDICGSWQRNFGLEDGVHRPERFDFHSLLESNRMINSGVYSKQLWESAGGFDPTMTDGYEDWEFWIRLASLGARASVIPEPLFLYRKHGRSMIDATMEKHDAIVRKIRMKYRNTVPKLEMRRPDLIAPSPQPSIPSEEWAS